MNDLLADYVDESPPPNVNKSMHSAKGKLMMKSMTKSGLPSSVPVLSVKSAERSSSKKSLKEVSLSHLEGTKNRRSFDQKKRT